jgi:hypothetical protein
MSQIPGQRLGGRFYLEMASRQGELPRHTLARALTVFKLFRDSLVLSQVGIIDREKHDHLPRYVAWTGPQYPPPRNYLLREGEESEFREFWQKYIEIPPGNFAVSHFRAATYRVYNTTRFTDYVESLEYLFVPAPERARSRVSLEQEHALPLKVTHPLLSEGSFSHSSRMRMPFVRRFSTEPSEEQSVYGVTQHGTKFRSL